MELFALDVLPIIVSIASRVLTVGTLAVIGVAAATAWRAR